MEKKGVGTRSLTLQSAKLGNAPRKEGVGLIGGDGTLIELMTGNNTQAAHRRQVLTRPGQTSHPWDVAGMGLRVCQINAFET
jgi:hypothetical protein